MNKILSVFGCVGVCFALNAAFGVSAGTVANDNARASLVFANGAGSYYGGGTTTTQGTLRGQRDLANAYIQNQRNI